MSWAAKKKFKAGDTLILEGEIGVCAYIIETGHVEVLMQRHGQLLQVATRGAGSIIGEMAMIDDKPRTATVRALEDCEVMEISRDDFTRRIDDADPIIKMIMRVIMTRYRDLMARTENFQVGQNLFKAEDIESSDSLRHQAFDAIRIDHELKDALVKGDLVLYYQPIIDLQAMKIAGFEALMRWKHPTKGMISPAMFIPVAEESGLITELSKLALDVSCDAIKELQKVANPRTTTPEPLFMSVNFSVKDFAEGDFFAHIQNTLQKKAVTPDQIHLEITETLLMETPELAKKALEKCRDHGVSISIDDFGSGYSSLSYLHYFPIDILKIDQSFIRSMSSSEASMVLVRSIVGLAKNLKMKIIAEGIETREEAKIIRDLGCEQCQGFWFAKPLPFEDALEFVKTWQPPE